MTQRAYRADLIGSIRGALAGLQGFDAMAFELIQNADDAKASRILFDVRDDCLIVENDSEFSDCGRVAIDPECSWKEDGNPSGGHRACDFHAISTVSSANKTGESALIGRFGVGFVSVYQITDRPVIASGMTELLLDPAAEGATVSSVHRVKGTRIRLPWATDSASPLRLRLPDFRLPPDAPSQMLEALLGAVGRALFFLRHVVEITVKRDGNICESVSIERVGARLSLRRASDKRTEDWLVLSGDASVGAAELMTRFDGGGLEHRQTGVQIAFRCGDSRVSEEWGRLYAYLPTDDPSGLPCHINGDFFPKQDRKTIVLAGHGAQQAWNELLLRAAAEAIATNLLPVRDALGASVFWHLLAAAHRLSGGADQPQRQAYRCFWEAIANRARGLPILPTASENTWSSPDEARLVRIGLPASTEAALRRLEISLPHASVVRVSGARDAIQALGGRALLVGDVAEALNALPAEDITPDDVRPLWPIVNTLLGASPAPTAADLDLLQLVPLVVEETGKIYSIDKLYRVPPGITNERIGQLLPHVPLVEEDIQQHSRLWQLIDLLGPTELASEVANLIRDPAAAQRLLGSDRATARRFYTLLATYPAMDTPEIRSTVRDTLAQCPFLKTANGFSSPRASVLPSGFLDPTGSISLVDAGVLDDTTTTFLKTVLGVGTLSFREYVVRRLPEILQKGIQKQHYRELMREFVRHEAVLRERDVAQAVRQLAICWRVDGRIGLPSQCFLRTRAFEELLGKDYGGWLDETALPNEHAELARSMLATLGLRTLPSAGDMVARIRNVAAAGPPTDDRRRLMSAIAGAIAKHIPDYERLRELQPLDLLKSFPWLPAKRAAGPDPSWQRPSGVYQPYRAEGFRSQVAVADLPTNGEGIPRLLALLGVPALPPADVVAAHWLWCVDRNEPLPEACYAILDEALKRGESDFLQALMERPIIWSSRQKRYLRARQVFWSLSRARLPEFHRAPEDFRPHKSLLDKLGVAEEPTAVHFSRWLVDLAARVGTTPLSGTDSVAHQQCMQLLADALEAEPEATNNVRAFLEDAAVIQSRAGVLAAPHEVAAVDAEWLAERLGDGFSGQLAVGGSRDKFARVYAMLGMPVLSVVARSKLVSAKVGQRLVDMEARLRAREPLLRCILRQRQPEALQRLAIVLGTLRIERATGIRVQYEFRLSDPPSVTKTVPTDVYADLDDAHPRILIDSEAKASGPTFLILRSVFMALMPGEPATTSGELAMAAKAVVEADGGQQAWGVLRDIGYADAEVEGASDAPGEEADLGGFGPPEEMEEQASAEEAPDDEGDETEPDDAGADNPETEPVPDRDPEPHTGAGGNDTNHRSGSTAPGAATRSSEPSSPIGPSAPQAGHNGPAPGSSRGATGNSDRPSGAPQNGPSSPNRSTRAPASGLITSTLVVAREAVQKIKDRYGKPFNASEKSDEGAMLAAVRYEVAAGRLPDVMPHNHPGFDIKSRNAAGELERLIEVKGIAGSWDGSAVRLSGVQFDHAAEHADTYWVYVVEFAQDFGKQRLFAIRDPFAHTDHFCLDDGWRYAAEDQTQGSSVRFVEGAAVRHKAFGRGTILEIRERGRMRNLQVKFQEGGTKNLLASDPLLEPLDT
jgi:hypothetical protein